MGVNTRTNAWRNVNNNTTKELSLWDFVRVKLSQLYSQVRKVVRDHDKKYIIVKKPPDIYIIEKNVKEDHMGLDKKRYTLKELYGQPLLTQLKNNNPNETRR